MSEFETKAKELAEFTFVRCKDSCLRLGMCCDDTQCEMALAVLERYSSTLSTVDRSIYLEALEISRNVDMVGGSRTARFLSADKTCKLPPHMRLFCTFHQCDIYGVAQFKAGFNGMTAEEATDHYYELREKVDNLFANQVNDLDNNEEE